MCIISVRGTQKVIKMNLLTGVSACLKIWGSQLFDSSQTTLASSGSLNTSQSIQAGSVLNMSSSKTCPKKYHGKRFGGTISRLCNYVEMVVKRRTALILYEME